MMKKLLNFVLIIAMLFNIAFPMGAVASTAPRAVLNITAPSTVLRGQEVYVSITADFATASNIQGLQVEFDYSDNFPSIIAGETKVLENTTGWGWTSINSGKIMGVGASAQDNSRFSGQVAFKIPENAAFGTVYTISLSGVKFADASGQVDASQYTVLNTSASIEVVDLPRVEGVSATDYQGEYDGDEHTAIVDFPADATIKYSEDGVSYELDFAPTFVNTGAHKVYYVVSREGNSDTYGIGNVVIDPKPLSDSMIDAISPVQYTGSQITPSVTVTDGSPSIITAEDYTVSYGDNINVATGGSVTITGQGNYTGTASKAFEILPITMTVDANNYEGEYDGTQHSASFDVTVPDSASVMYGEEDGVYNLTDMPSYKDAGTYTVYYKAVAENYEDYTGSVKVIITPKSLTDAMVEDIPAFDYTGSQITPAVSVADGDLLTSEDYTVSYGENINVATGGSVIIEGKGNYKGTVQKSFVINPIAMTVNSSGYDGVYDGALHAGTVDVQIPSGATVKYGTTEGEYPESEMPSYKDVGTYTVYYKATDPNYIDNTGSFVVNITPKSLADEMLADIPDMPYTGSQITPDVSVTDGNPSIITTEDYTVSYGENVNVATGGSVTITGKGNYEGNILKTFVITPIDMTVSPSDYTGTFDGEYHTATYTVTAPVDAEIKYGTTEGTYDLDEMPSYRNVGEYTVYYKATNPNYIDNTGSVKVTINPKEVSADMIEEIPATAYTGSQITPDISVTDGDPSKITAEDYTVSYGENVNVATGGSVTITGKGNYTGTATKAFTITPIDMDVNAIGYDGVYDGANHTVSVTTITPASAEIRYGTALGDYSLTSAPEFKNAGNNAVYYKITAENYNEVTGVLNVNIAPKTLTEEMLENISAQEFTGLQITPSVTLRDVPPCEITLNDYTVSYGTNITVAEGGSVTVTGQGNYTGVVTKNFEISNAILRADKVNYTGVYDGQAHKATVTITNCDNAQIMYGTAEGTYDLSEMPEYTNAGNYVVYFKATAENFSNCTGSVEVNIAPKPLTEEMVADISAYTYTSMQITPAVSVADMALLTSEDYDVAYGENITVAGGGNVTVTAKRNYTGTVTKNFEITKAELNITSENKVITYGDAFAITINYSGFVGTETKDVLISEAVASGFDVTPCAGTYEITLGGAQADNYNITYGSGYTLTVNKKTVTLTALSVFDKAYDETCDAVINETTATFEGVISGDSVVLDITNATAAFATADIGDGIAVTVSGLALGGEDSGNYELASDTFATTASIKATITAADIAAQIMSISIDKNATELVLPVVPEGYAITLKSSSDEAVIGLDGKITSAATDINVNLVFTVSNADGSDTADTLSITATVPAHDVYQVTATAEANGTVSGSGAYAKNTLATVTATPASGYKFDGWYDGSVLVSTNATYTFKVQTDVSLIAKFSAVTYSGGGGGGSVSNYTVKFVTNGGTEIKSLKIKNGMKISDIPTPQKEGYIFDGWYTDSKFKKPFDADTKITKTTTLYAKWIEKVEEEPEKPEEPEEPVEPEKPEEVKVSFTDVNESEWYYNAVRYVVSKGLFNGVTKSEFAPDASLTRAMLVAVLYRAEAQPEVTASHGFADVKDGEYYSDAVIWASQNGIVSGVSETEFMPDSNITREQIAAIIYRYAQYKGIVEATSVALGYNDNSDISEWAKEAVAFCKSMKIMTGNDVNKFMPLANATRAEVAATLQRFFSAE